MLNNERIFRVHIVPAPFSPDSGLTISTDRRQTISADPNINAYDKYFPFQISSNILERVVLNGNNIGNCYAFTRRSAGATISSVGSSGSHNQYGMTITYDHSGCDYTGQTWHNGWWLFGWHDRYMEYWTGRAYMY